MQAYVIVTCITTILSNDIDIIFHHISDDRVADEYLGKIPGTQKLIPGNYRCDPAS